MDVAQQGEGLARTPPGRSMIGDLAGTCLAVLIGLPGGFAVDLAMRQLGLLYDGGLSFPLFATAIGPLTVLVVVLAVGPHPPRTLARSVGGYMGWLAFASIYFGLYLWQWIFAPLRGSSLTVLGWVFTCLLAVAAVVAGVLTGEFVLSFLQRLRRKPVF